MNDRKNFLIKHFGLRGVAIFEAAKGLVSLAVGVWVFTLVRQHKDLGKVAGHLLSSMHVGPERHFYQRVLHEAGLMSPHTLWLVALAILMYAIVRFVEAAGLWLEKEWAEWFAVLTGSMYLPWELYTLVRHATWIKWGVFIINILIVLYLAWLLTDSYKRKRQQADTVKVVDD